MELANYLRAAIIKSKLTQLALAQATGVPQQRISAFMNGGDMKLRHAGALLEVPAIKREVVRLLRAK